MAAGLLCDDVLKNGCKNRVRRDNTTGCGRHKDEQVKPGAATTSRRGALSVAPAAATVAPTTPVFTEAKAQTAKGYEPGEPISAETDRRAQSLLSDSNLIVPITRAYRHASSIEIRDAMDNALAIFRGEIDSDEDTAITFGEIATNPGVAKAIAQQYSTTPEQVQEVLDSVATVLSNPNAARDLGYRRLVDEAVALEAQASAITDRQNEIKATLRAEIAVGGAATKYQFGDTTLTLTPVRKFDPKIAEKELTAEQKALCMKESYDSKRAEANLPPELYEKCRVDSTVAVAFK